MDEVVEQDQEYRIDTSDWSDWVGKTRFTTELTFVRCMSGSALIVIDSTEHALMAGHSFILSEYLTLRVMQTTADFRVTYISISLPFYYEIVANFEGAIFNVLLLSAPELYTVSELHAADLIFENLCILYPHSNYSHRRAMAMNLIACYIYEIYELTLPHIDSQMLVGRNSRFTETINSLYNLVSVYGYKDRSIDFYARKLNMSSRYLYRIVQSSCHITPKQLIDEVIVSLVKQLLLTTSLDNQQISDKFNFPDQSAFGQYFKRCEGLSPSAFRDKHR